MLSFRRKRKRTSADMEEEGKRLKIGPREQQPDDGDVVVKE